MDGDYVLGWVKADNGWAFNGVLPSYVEYTLETPYLLTQIRILTGMERTNHIITKFLIEVFVQTLQICILKSLSTFREELKKLTKKDVFKLLFVICYI